MSFRETKAVPPGAVSTTSRRMGRPQRSAEEAKAQYSHSPALASLVHAQHPSMRGMSDAAVSTRVQIAIRRFKGDRSDNGYQPETGMARLVNAALHRKQLLDAVQESVKEEEKKTGQRLMGDENTGNMERLIERVKTTRQAKDGTEPNTCKDGYLAFRLRVGQVVTHAVVRYLIILLILIDICLFMIEINNVLQDYEDVLHVVEHVIIWTFVAEVAAKMLAFEKEFFSSWWNIFDFIVVLVSVVIVALQQGLLAVLFARSLKLFGSINRTLRVFRIVVKVYTHGSAVSKRKSTGLAYPIEQVVNILRKVRFSGALTREEREQIGFLTDALLGNTLYIPNLDQITEELQDNSQVPDWILSNFNSKPRSAHSSTRTVHSHISRKVRSFTNVHQASHMGSVAMGSVATMLDEQLDTYEFDIFKFNKITMQWPLFHLFSAIIQWHGLCDEVGFSMKTVTKFIKAIERQYLASNAYHSNIHGADVLQTVHVLLTAGGAGDRFSSLERMSLLMAAAAHDVAHPGLSNNFLVATGHKEALLRNDTSVLEHMHSFVLFKTMQEPGCNLYSGLASQAYKAQRHLMIQLILRTDLAQHFELVGQFKSNTLSAMEKPTDAQDWRLMQMTMILKMADISHPTKAWLTHSQWTQRCMTEFYSQGDKEKKLGLKVSPLCDRDTTNIPTAQIGFIKVLVAPLFNAWAEAHMQLGWGTATANSSRAADTFDPDDQPSDGLGVLHQIDENLTTNLNQWTSINNGETKLEWELDVTDESKWTAMCEDIDKRLAEMKTPNVAQSPDRVFKTLDGAAALQTPKPSPGRRAFPSSRFEEEQAGAGAGAGAGASASARSAATSSSATIDVPPRRGWSKDGSHRARAQVVNAPTSVPARPSPLGRSPAPVVSVPGQMNADDNV